jgi:hypothetical protein
MTGFYRKALALGTAAAIAATASSALAGPTGPFGTQVKKAVPSATTDVRVRRGAAIAAGVIGAAGVAIAVGAANNANYGYGPYGYYDGGYYGDAYYGGGYYDGPYYGGGYAYGGYQPGPYVGYRTYAPGCNNSSMPERSTC